MTTSLMFRHELLMTSAESPMVNTQAGFFVAHRKHAGEVQGNQFLDAGYFINQAQGLIWMEFILVKPF